MTFPVDQGQNMSVMAYVTNDRGGWPSDKTQCVPTTKAEALDDFREFGPNVKHIINLAVGDFEKVSWGNTQPRLSSEESGWVRGLTSGTVGNL
jgi:hypothetical protein